MSTNPKPKYDSYKLSWEVLNVFMEGVSPLDIYSFMGQLKNEDQVAPFMAGYGFDIDNPIQNAELFGTYQESLQFIKRYFLKEGSPDGLDMVIPHELYVITDIKQLFLLATKEFEETKKIELALWAGIILKVMHTFLHADKDLRHRYFSAIQTQILDKLYRYIYRTEDGVLLGTPKEKYQIPLKDFQTKSKKSRDSIVIKLLHKKENVAEELFDRIGVRFITENKFDALRVIKFLVDHYVVVTHNIKPSRSQNSLVDLKKLKIELGNLYQKAKAQNMPEEEYYLMAQELTNQCDYIKSNKENDNEHSHSQYKAIHFTYRQLVKYTNPFMHEFNKVKSWAKENKDNPASAMILKLDTSTISRDVMFFYPFEVQITDLESHQSNTLGEASHREYKVGQIKSAAKRLFKPLIELKSIEF